MPHKHLPSKWRAGYCAKENAETWGGCTTSPNSHTAKNNVQPHTSFMQPRNASVVDSITMWATLGIDFKMKFAPNYIFWSGYFKIAVSRAANSGPVSQMLLLCLMMGEKSNLLGSHSGHLFYTFSSVFSPDWEYSSEFTDFSPIFNDLLLFRLYEVECISLKSTVCSLIARLWSPPS